MEAFAATGRDSLRHYTPEEAAEFLPVSAATLRQWIYARKVPHHKLGGNPSFSTEDIRAHVCHVGRSAIARTHTYG
ncbi:helix-turn-helix domain-containing protein [Streptomyces sp. NPDC054840]